MASHKDSNQADLDVLLAYELTKLMVIALERKDEDLARGVEKVGEILEDLGFFQSNKDVYLPFSTTYDSVISEYIEDEKEGIVGLEDEARYNTNTKWGIPDTLELYDYALGLDNVSASSRYGDSRDFEAAERLNQAKARKLYARRVAEEERTSKASKQYMKPIYDKLEEISKLNKKNSKN